MAKSWGPLRTGNKVIKITAQHQVTLQRCHHMGSGAWPLASWALGRGLSFLKCQMGTVAQLPASTVVRTHRGCLWDRTLHTVRP
jgi:hypothetical protein